MTRWKSGVPQKKDEIGEAALDAEVAHFNALRDGLSEHDAEMELLSRVMLDHAEVRALLDRIENGEPTRSDYQALRRAALAIRGAEVTINITQMHVIVFNLVVDYKRSAEQCVARGRDLAKLNSVFESELRNAFDGVVVVDKKKRERNLEELLGALDLEEADFGFLRSHEEKTGTIHVLRRLGFWDAPLSASDAIGQVKAGVEEGERNEHRRRVADLRQLLKNRSK